MTNTILTAAQRYTEAGFYPIPLDPMTKKPSLPSWSEPGPRWQNLELVFTPNRNIGILLGKASGGLIDVDLDCPDAIALADHLLPKTDMIFGRQSAQRSHRIYRCNDCTQNRTAFASDRLGSILELRADKHQTVFPPSIHESGEQITFAANGGPLAIEFGQLEAGCKLTAIGAVLLPNWKQGVRHSLSLAVAGLFATAGWVSDDVKTLFRAICAVSGDDETDNRLSNVDTSYQRVKAQQPVTGKYELRRLTGDDAKKIFDWIGVPARTADQSDVTTDAGAAMAFAMRNQDQLKYVPEERSWYARDKNVYRPASQDQVQGAAIEFMMQACNNFAGQHQFQQAKQLLSRGRINAIPELARSELGVSVDTLDADPYLVGCKHGEVLDLHTRTFVDPGSTIVTKTLGTDFDPSAQCPTWLRFLDDIFPNDPETIAFLQRALGYTLTGLVDEQCLFVLVGTGANGKSTFIEIAQRLLGEYATTTPMLTLMVNRSEQTNDLAALVGKRLVSASEGEVGQRLAESRIKLMVGGDRIKCRRLYQEHIEMKPQFKLWVLTNNLPTISGTDEAIWRRIRVVRFPVTIPVEKRDGRLPDTLGQELPGILNWALDGLQAWLNDRLQAPEKVRAETNHYRTDNDTVGQFIDACCEMDKVAKATTKELYLAYTNWCERSGYEPIHVVVFGKTLGLKGFASHKSAKGAGWRGIKLKSVLSDPS